MLRPIPSIYVWMPLLDPLTCKWPSQAEAFKVCLRAISLSLLTFSSAFTQSGAPCLPPPWTLPLCSRESHPDLQLRWLIFEHMSPVLTQIQFS